MRILHLYRPQLPGTRAQAIQVLHACHTLASLGHRVTLLADRGQGTADDALAGFGLAPVDGLDLRLAPTSQRTAAGLWFRAQALAWWAGPPGVVLARDKGRLRWLLRTTGDSHRHRVVLEAHELDSAQLAERGEDPHAAAELERWLLPRLDGLITNCGGTMEMWQETHGDALPQARVVAHNAVSASRRRGPRPPDAVIRCVGSLRAYKGVAALAEAAGLLPLPVELIGGSPDEQAALGAVPENVRLRPPVPYAAVPDILCRSAVLVLPLADNLFGRRLTSPLKLWDYLATSVPIVAPDLPTTREIDAMSGHSLHWFAPQQPDSLVRAVQSALSAPHRSPFVRTWQERAKQTLPVLLGEASS